MPTLRSSARSSNSTGRSTDSPSGPTPTRKEYTCRTCKQPRRGHPRNRCPTVNDVIKQEDLVGDDEGIDSDATNSGTEILGSPDEQLPSTPSPRRKRTLSNAMSSMRLQAVNEPTNEAIQADRRQAARLRRPTSGATPTIDKSESGGSPRGKRLRTVGPSPSFQDLFHALNNNDDEEAEAGSGVEAGDSEMMQVDDDCSDSLTGGLSQLSEESLAPPDSRKKVLRWQDAIIQQHHRRSRMAPSPSFRRGPRELMPGTLYAPSLSDTDSNSQNSSFSQASSDHIFYKQEEEEVSPAQLLGTAPPPPTSLLARNLSDEESEELVRTLLDIDAPGLIVTVPKGISINTKYAAQQVGLFTRQRILSDDEESFLVIGTDEKEVERLWVMLLKLEGHTDPAKFAGLPGLVGVRGAGVESVRRGAANEKNKQGGRKAGNLGYMAGAAAAGAAAMFTSLAWSP